jgi:hypothetical protein
MSNCARLQEFNQAIFLCPNCDFVKVGDGKLDDQRWWKMIRRLHNKTCSYNGKRAKETNNVCGRATQEARIDTSKAPGKTGNNPRCMNSSYERDENGKMVMTHMRKSATEDQWNSRQINRTIQILKKAKDMGSLKEFKERLGGEGQQFLKEFMGAVADGTLPPEVMPMKDAKKVCVQMLKYLV